MLLNKSCFIHLTCLFPSDLRFHHLHGKNARILNGGLTAQRPNAHGEFNDAIVISNRQLHEGEIFEVMIDKMVDRWSGSLEAGRYLFLLSSHSPLLTWLPIHALLGQFCKTITINAIFCFYHIFTHFLTLKLYFLHVLYNQQFYLLIHVFHTTTSYTVYDFYLHGPPKYVFLYLAIQTDLSPLTPHSCHFAFSCFMAKNFLTFFIYFTFTQYSVTHSIYNNSPLLHLLCSLKYPRKCLCWKLTEDDVIREQDNPC